jgi:Ser/Thr protein kinase RdoA (MazF antagonist)
MSNQYDKLIENALSQYGIYDYNSVFIRHNENITFKIINNIDQSNYLLRVHIPISPGIQGIQHTFEGLIGELEFLNSLADKTCLLLQQPVKNKNGSFVTTIIDSNSTFCPLATLLTWKEGEVFNGNEINSHNIAYEVGVVLAQLHNFSSNWTIPQPYIRPNYDIDKYINLTKRLQHGVNLNLFKTEHYNIISNTMKEIKTIFDGTPKTKNNWGIIHADLQGGNIIVNNNTVIPIDFGFSGYGYYLFDIGITLASFNIIHRERVIEGYKTLRSIESGEERLVSAGFILGIIGAFGFSISNTKSHEWIQRRIPYVTQKYCLSLLDKKSFILALE